MSAIRGWRVAPIIGLLGLGLLLALDPAEDRASDGFVVPVLHPGDEPSKRVIERWMRDMAIVELDFSEVEEMHRRTKDELYLRFIDLPTGEIAGRGRISKYHTLPDSLQELALEFFMVRARAEWAKRKHAIALMESGSYRTVATRAEMQGLASEGYSIRHHRELDDPVAVDLSGLSAFMEEVKERTAESRRKFLVTARDLPVQGQHGLFTSIVMSP